MLKFSINSMIKLFVLIGILTSCSESPEEYNKRAFSVADSIIKYSDVNFSVASDCQTMWRSVVFDSKYIQPIFHAESYCSDFNEGIAKYKNDLSIIDENFIKANNVVDSLYGTVSKEVPEKSQPIFNNIKEMLNIYKQSYEMMREPSGSLQSYTSNLNDLFQKYKDLKSKIEIDKK